MFVHKNFVLHAGCHEANRLNNNVLTQISEMIYFNIRELY